MYDHPVLQYRGTGLVYHLSRIIDARSPKYHIVSLPLKRRLAGIDQWSKLIIDSAAIPLAWDLDATGGMVWSGVLRGGTRRGGRKPTTVGPQKTVESFEVDGIPASRLHELDFAWSLPEEGVLVFGDERGMQRQLRQVRRPRESGKEPIHRYAARLRKRATVMMAFSLSERIRGQLGRSLPNLGPMLAAVQAGNSS